jgi:uncharacterized protein (DUF952 family)
MNIPTIIYHLASKDDWEAAAPSGEYEAASLEEEGFIHCSKDIPQLLAVTARLYPGREDLLVLDVDTSLLEAPVKHEPSRSGEIYPHIYGKLNTGAVVRQRVLTLGPDGLHRVKEG